MEKRSILNFTLDELSDFLVNEGFKKFNASQIFQWIYKKNVFDFNSMTNLSKSLRKFLNDNFFIFSTEMVNKQVSKDKTIKFALKTSDNFLIESVIIFDKKRITLCVSSQIGCPLNCDFCLTGKLGFKRNLKTYEILEQVLYSAKLGFLPTNIVFMGMGEPLLNLDNLVKSLEILFDKNALNYSKRKITVSTAGICDKMLLLNEKIPFLSYAISLHAPNDEKRNEIMPINKKYPIKTLIETLKKIELKPKRKFTIEYICIDDFNVSRKDALELMETLKGIKYKINLIPYNENPFSYFKAPSEEKLTEFQNVFTKAGIIAKIRESKGGDISAACGQLAYSDKIKNK